MKKNVLIFFLLFLLPLVLFATGEQEQKSAGPVTLDLWYPAGEITSTSMPFRDNYNAWEEFEKANNCKINIIAVDYDTMQQKLFTALAGGKAPDIGFVDDSWMGGFMKDNTLVPIPEAAAKAWLSSVTPEIVSLSDWGGGKMYGFPSWGVDAYALTWNKDMFKAAGLNPDVAPKYWDDFRQASKKTAVTEGGSLTRVGYAIRHLGKPAGIVDKWDWLLGSAGAKYNEDQYALKGGRTIVNTPDARKGFQMAKDMLYVDKSTSLDFPDPRDCLLKGLAAMQISEVISIQVRAPREAPDLKWAFAPPPAMKAGTNPSVKTAAWNTVVFTQSKNKDLAMKAIMWYNNVENDYKHATRYKSTPRYKENWEKEPLASDPYIIQFKTLLPYGRPYPKSLALNGIVESIGAAIQKILHNEMDVEPALAEAERKANEAIQMIK